MNTKMELNEWISDGKMYSPLSNSRVVLFRSAIDMQKSGACGTGCGAASAEPKKASACGAGDPKKKEEKPSACGSACGAGDPEKKDEKPSASGSACGAGDPEKKDAKPSACGSACGAGRSSQKIRIRSAQIPDRWIILPVGNWQDQTGAIECIHILHFNGISPMSVINAANIVTFFQKADNFT